MVAFTENREKKLRKQLSDPMKSVVCLFLNTVDTSKRKDGKEK